MNILLISNMYPDASNPSYGIFVKNQVELLESENISIDLQVIYKRKTKLAKIISYIYHYLIVFIKIIYKKYDFIYVHYVSLNSLPILAGTLFRKQLIVANIHGSDIITKNKIQKIIDKFTTKLLNKSSTIIVPSSYYKKIASEKYKLPKEIFFVSPSAGINPKVFYPMKNKIINNRFIGYVGRVEADKGWEYLLRAFKDICEKNSYNNITLFLVGDGAESSKRDKLIKKYNLEDKIIVKHFTTQDELANIYNKIDILIFPSLRESLGLVGLEAMACGTPVIGSDIGGIRTYLVDGVNGFLSNPKDSQSIAENIEKFFSLTNYEKQRMSKEAFKTAQRYTDKKVKREFMEIINNHVMN